MTSAVASVTLDISSTPPTPFSRLVRVELRKMLDTRAGFWLVLVAMLISAVAAVIALLVHALSDAEVTAMGWVNIMNIPLGIFLPVIAILSVTSEWSQRTALVSFSLEPHRMRVIGAKYVAVLGLAMSAMLFAVVMGALGNILGGVFSSDPVQWDAGLDVVAGVSLSNAIFLTMAFAFGMLFLSSAAAIAIYFVVTLVLPILVYAPLTATLDWFEDAAVWFDLGSATSDLTLGDMSGAEWLHTLVTVAIWVALPALIGLRRLERSEVK